MFSPLRFRRYLAPVLSAGMILTAADAVGAADPPAGAERRLEAMSQQLVALSVRYRGAPTPALLDRLTALAGEREALMADLIADHPAAILEVALPERLAAGIPPAARAHVEERLEIEGELEVLHVDARDPRDSRYLHFLDAPEFDERFQLHFAGEPPALLTGTPVRAHGVVVFGATDEHDDLDGAMAVDSGTAGLDVLAAGDETVGNALATATPEVPNTLGEQRLLVILGNFVDDPSQPWTVTEVEDLVFGTVGAFYRENSYGLTWLAGDVAGWFTTSLSKTECKLGVIADKLRSAAAAAGFELTTYQRFVYMLPRNACPGDGIAVIWGTPSQAWINDRLEAYVVGHELGHGLGLLHAQGRTCTDAVLGTDCTTKQYGDTLDIMGDRLDSNGDRAAHMNAFAKERLGWLGFEGAPDTWYYVERRQPIGFDAFIAANDNVLNGVVVHAGTEGDGDSSFLLDMDPGQPTGYGSRRSPRPRPGGWPALRRP